MLEQDADDQLNGVPHAQDVEELEEAVVKKRKLLWHPERFDFIKKYQLVIYNKLDHFLEV